MGEEEHPEFFAQDADYVRLDMKRLTAERMAGWLSEYADYCDSNGWTETADHARYVGKMLREEINDGE